METIKIFSISVSQEFIDILTVKSIPSIDNNSKSFVLNGVEYFFDHSLKSKLDPIKQILDVNLLKDTGCKRKQGICKNLECKHCYGRSLLGNPKYIYYSKENIDHPRFITMSMNGKIKMNCNKCHHIFEISPSNLKAGRWCPYCSTSVKRFCDNMECYKCYQRSYSSNKGSKLWSNKNGISPRYVARCSGKKYIFECNICKHEFLSSLDKDLGCAYCSHRKLCDSDICIPCYKNSFASSEYVKLWSPENDVSPRQVFKYSNSKKYKFICDKCDHTYEMVPLHISYGQGCSYCANRILCGNCDLCHNKSLASYEDVKYYSTKNIVNPKMIFKKCGATKYIFNCEHCGDEYWMFPFNFTAGIRGCTCIKYKTEAKLFKHLSIDHNVIKQYKFSWCINPETNKKLPFDFYIPKFNLLIELDGDQHFKKISNWTSNEKTREKDVLKMILLLNNNLSLIRIYQEDVWGDKNNWKEKLNKNIKKYDDPIIVLIENDKDLYKKHFDDLIYKKVPIERITIDKE